MNWGLARTLRLPKSRNDFQGESRGRFRHLTSKSQLGSAVLIPVGLALPAAPPRDTSSAVSGVGSPERRDSPGSSLPGPWVHVHLT